MANYITLVEIALDAATEYCSFRGVSADRWYADYVEEISPITRECPRLPGEATVSDCSIVLNDFDSHWSTLKNSAAFYGRTVSIKFGEASAGIAAFTTLYTGIITDVSFEAGHCLLEVRDVSYDLLDNELTGMLTDITSPVLPPGVAATLLPIIYGTHSSVGGTNAGAVPAYRLGWHNKVGDFTGRYYYAVARHLCAIDRIYVYGKMYSWSAAAGDTITPFWPSPYNNMAIIGFYVDPLDPDRDADFEVTADVRGVDYATTLMINPVSQLAHYLENYAGVSSGDIDMATAIAAAVHRTSALWIGGQTITHREVLNKFLQSFGMNFFHTRAGKYAAFMPDYDAIDLDTLTALSDQVDVVRESFGVEFPEDLASKSEYLFAFDPTTDEYTRRESVEVASETANLGQAITVAHEFPCVRDQNQAAALAHVALYRMRENQQYFTFALPVEHYTLDLNQNIKMSHYQGPSASGLGYDSTVGRILQLEIAAAPREAQINALCENVFNVGADDVYPRYFKLGALATLGGLTWPGGSNQDYGALCALATNKFANNQDGKRLFTRG